VVEPHDGLPREQRECFGVVLDLACALEHWRERLCLIGGWATYALTEVFFAGTTGGPLRHRGSTDVDLAVGLLRIDADEAEALGSRLREAGYRGPESFHWRRVADSGSTYRVDMMTLPPPRHEGGVVRIGAYEFAPFWHGEAVFVSPRDVKLRGALPDGTPREALLRVASPGGMLVVKAWTLATPGRPPQAKHLYDIFALLRTYPGGPEEFAVELRDMRGTEDLQVTLDLLQIMFVDSDDGPRLVAEQRMGPPADWDLHVAEARLTVERFLRAMGRG